MRIIEGITIRYYRSVYNITISPCNDITVITGKNDVGKSNILKALNLFFNQQSDFMKPFDFIEDYSLLRKEEVKKDTIRGQQFISITIRFVRGNKMEKTLPPHFSVTRRWDMHSPEYKQSTDVYTRMQAYAKKEGLKYSEKTTSTVLSMFLNKIKFVYVPAIKDQRVFSGVLSRLQQNLFDTKTRRILDEPINNANEAIQGVLIELQNDFEESTGIKNFVQLPKTIYTTGLLQINTQVRGGEIAIDKHGDGIRTHYLPKILDFVSNHSKNVYIWGFEEPENSYEYRRCLQVAEEFELQYCKKNQIFITSHSPAFYYKTCDNKTIINLGAKDNKTVLLKNTDNLDEELGYINLYQDFIDKVKELEAENKQQSKNIDSLKAELQNANKPIILTEGKTDSSLLKLSIKKLCLDDYSSWTIKPITCEKTSNNEALKKFLCEMRDNLHPHSLVIGMFDRDTKMVFDIDGQKTDIRTKPFIKICHNVYAFSIPVPQNRSEVDQISIEHYFTDEEIKTEDQGKRLFIGNEFFETGVHKENKDLFYKAARKIFDSIKIIEHESNCFVTKTDGEGDFSISKARFVENIENDEPGFCDISFEEFRKIFEIINAIILDWEESSEILDRTESDQLVCCV
ncbi:MAG: AAA family ATPase [Clostridia bacterium]|nr:AAA family ATPase [Clostridia bacterium]MBR0414208.1 AAA family ATPase [Clostridia bacterium]